MTALGPFADGAGRTDVDHIRADADHVEVHIVADYGRRLRAVAEHLGDVLYAPDP